MSNALRQWNPELYDLTVQYYNQASKQNPAAVNSLQTTGEPTRSQPSYDSAFSKQGGRRKKKKSKKDAELEEEEEDAKGKKGKKGAKNKGGKGKKSKKKT